MARPNKHAVLLERREHHLALAKAYDLVVQDLTGGKRKTQAVADKTRMVGKLKRQWTKRAK